MRVGNDSDTQGSSHLTGRSGEKGGKTRPQVLWGPTSRPLRPGHENKGKNQVGDHRIPKKSPGGRISRQAQGQSLDPARPAFFVAGQNPPSLCVGQKIKKHRSRQRTTQPTEPRGPLGKEVPQRCDQQVSHGCRRRESCPNSQAVMKVQHGIRHQEGQKGPHPVPWARKIKCPA